jgi:hypothetical protein
VAGATTVRELMARAFYEKTRPGGPPFDMLKDAEREKLLAGADAALEVIWSFDRD